MSEKRTTEKKISDVKEDAVYDSFTLDFMLSRDDWNALDEDTYENLCGEMCSVMCAIEKFACSLVEKTDTRVKLRVVLGSSEVETKEYCS